MGKVKKTMIKKRKKKKIKHKTVRRRGRGRVQRGGFCDNGGMTLYQSIMIGLNQGMGTNQDLVPLIEQSALLD